MLHFEEVEWNCGLAESQKKILFLSDLHMLSDKRLALEKEDVIDYIQNRRIYMQTYGILDTRERLEEFLCFIQQENFDLVIFGGDIIDSPSSENLELLCEILEKLRLPYLFTSGNHDWNYSWDYLTDKSKERYQTKLLEAVKKESLDGMVESYFGIPFLLVDSSCNAINVKALQELSRIEKSGPLCLVMHVPFTTSRLRELSLRKWGFETTMGGRGLAMNDVTRAFWEELSLHENVLLLCGHVHGFADDLLSPHVRQIVAPAACEGEGVIIHLKG